MLVLALDPGETIGFARMELNIVIGGENTLMLLSADQVPLDITKQGFIWDTASQELTELFAEEPDVVVIEDYRVYTQKAMAHAGSRVLTSELIGAICHEAAVNQIPVVRLAAGTKGSWPQARIDAKYQLWHHVPHPHAGDAVILGLVYAESQGWKP